MIMIQSTIEEYISYVVVLVHTDVPWCGLEHLQDILSYTFKDEGHSILYVIHLKAS